MDFNTYLKIRQDLIDRRLRDYLRNLCGPEFDYLRQAASYSLYSGGKRLRPILAMAACEAVGGDENKVVPFGCALEMIHTFSLIHDDLPAMDDDDFRRNMPTNHKVYGEAHAILAGDTLLAEAFRMIADKRLYPDVEIETGMEVMREVADAAGICGMVGGQSLDLLAENKPVEEHGLYMIHLCKTARFMAASAVTGALVAKADASATDALRRYGENLGLTFQIVDDILNETGEAKAMGKSVGSDAKRHKATYPALFGVDESRKKAAEYVRKAVGQLEPFGGNALRLREIAEYILTRDR